MRKGLRKLSSYNIHEEDVQVSSPPLSPQGIWLVRVWATNGKEQLDIHLENKKACFLATMNDLVQQHFMEVISELSPVTDGGFTVYQRT